MRKILWKVLLNCVTLISVLKHFFVKYLHISKTSGIWINVNVTIYDREPKSCKIRLISLSVTHDSGIYSMLSVFTSFDYLTWKTFDTSRLFEKKKNMTKFYLYLLMSAFYFSH